MPLFTASNIILKGGNFLCIELRLNLRHFSIFYVVNECWCYNLAFSDTICLFYDKLPFCIKFKNGFLSSMN